MSAFFRKIPARLPHEGAPSRCTGASSNRANGVERPSRQNRRRVHAMAVHALCVIRLARASVASTLLPFRLEKSCCRRSVLALRPRQKKKIPCRPPHHADAHSDQLPIRTKHSDIPKRFANAASSKTLSWSRKVDLARPHPRAHGQTTHRAWSRIRTDAKTLV